MSTIVNFKADEKIKKEAQEIAKEMGVSLSSVLNMFMAQFVRDRELNIKLNELDIREEKFENFNKKTQKHILEAEEEHKSGKMKFYNSKEAVEFISALAKE